MTKNDIAVYAAHTNLDVAPGGVNDLLADALELVKPTNFRSIRTMKKVNEASSICTDATC